MRSSRVMLIWLRPSSTLNWTSLWASESRSKKYRFTSVDLYRWLRNTLKDSGAAGSSIVSPPPWLPFDGRATAHTSAVDASRGRAQVTGPSAGRPASYVEQVAQRIFAERHPGETV